MVEAHHRVSECVVPTRSAGSLACIAGFVAVAAIVGNMMELLFVDFIHGNPHRTHGNALTMMILYSPVFGLVAAVGVLLIFGLSQCCQAVVSNAAHRFGCNADLVALLAVPMTAVITWYSFDYLTPSNLSPDYSPAAHWAPYQHGMTATRYLVAVVAQTLVTLFTVTYGRTAAGGLSRKALMYVALIAAVFAGAVFGHRMAVDQYQFL